MTGLRLLLRGHRPALAFAFALAAFSEHARFDLRIFFVLRLSLD